MLAHITLLLHRTQRPHEPQEPTIKPNCVKSMHQTVAVNSHGIDPWMQAQRAKKRTPNLSNREHAQDMPRNTHTHALSHVRARKPLINTRVCAQTTTHTHTYTHKHTRTHAHTPHFTQKYTFNTTLCQTVAPTMWLNPLARATANHQNMHCASNRKVCTHACTCK